MGRSEAVAHSHKKKLKSYRFRTETTTQSARAIYKRSGIKGRHVSAQQCRCRTLPLCCYQNFSPWLVGRILGWTWTEIGRIFLERRSAVCDELTDFSHLFRWMLREALRLLLSFAWHLSSAVRFCEIVAQRRTRRFAKETINDVGTSVGAPTFLTSFVAGGFFFLGRFSWATSHGCQHRCRTAALAVEPYRLTSFFRIFFAMIQSSSCTKAVAALEVARARSS